MAQLYPEIEPYEHGMLDVADGHSIYWEQCGNPQGRPVLAVHGGPGSGASMWWRRLFNPDAYRIVLFDQRNCGRSLPHASRSSIDLSTNTTQHLLSDMERLRALLGIERWMVFGGSWGSTLGLAYAVEHSERVTDLILFGVTTGRRWEWDWLFRGNVAIFFPEQWDALVASLPEEMRGGDVVAALNQLLHDPDPEVVRRATYAWCLWESATPDWPPKPGLDERFEDEAYALAFARIVIHYAHHNGFLEDGVLLEQAGALADIPGALVTGRFDFQAPLGNAWALHRVWPRAELVIVEDAGHSGLGETLVEVTDRFAERC